MVLHYIHITGNLFIFITDFSIKVTPLRQEDMPKMRPNHRQFISNINIDGLICKMSWRQCAEYLDYYMGALYYIVSRGRTAFFSLSLGGLVQFKFPHLF